MPRAADFAWRHAAQALTPCSEACSSLTSGPILVDRESSRIIGGFAFAGQLADQPTKAAANAVADALGLPKREVYQRALQIKADG